MKLDRLVFRALLDLVMCSDPWPVLMDEFLRTRIDKKNRNAVERFLDDQSKLYEYEDWIDAYHRFKVVEK